MKEQKCIVYWKAGRQHSATFACVSDSFFVWNKRKREWNIFFHINSLKQNRWISLSICCLELTDHSDLFSVSCALQQFFFRFSSFTHSYTILPIAKRTRFISFLSCLLHLIFNWNFAEVNSSASINISQRSKSSVIKGNIKRIER